MKWMSTLMSVVIVLAGIELIVSPAAWANTTGSVAGGTPSCVRSKTDSNKQTLKLTGAVAINVTSNIDQGGSTQEDVDVVARLQEKNGAPRFYRVHLYTPFNSLSNPERACRIFNPGDTFDPAVQQSVTAFVNKIISDYQLPSNTQFVILGSQMSDGTWDTSQSIYNYESPTSVLVVPNSTNNVPGGSPALSGNPGTGIPPGDHAATMSDITIYAVY